LLTSAFCPLGTAEYTVEIDRPMRREHRWNARGASQRLLRHLQFQYFNVLHSGSLRSLVDQGWIEEDRGTMTGPLAGLLDQHGHIDDPLRVIATSRNAKPLNIQRVPALEGLTSETDALAEFMRRPASSL
jgi:hypothetical protein